MSDKSKELIELRRQAEKQLRSRHGDPLTVPPDQLPQLTHELLVYQIELEMQNEELGRSQQELEAARDAYADLFDLAPVGYFSLDGAGRILRANLNAAGLLGLERRQLVNKGLYDFIASESRDMLYKHLRRTLQNSEPVSCELQLVRRDGAQFFAHLQSIAQNDNQGDFNHYLTVISDVSERHRHEEQILRQANYDMLTGLPNRVLFMDRLEQAVHFAQRERTRVALMYIDMDRFKWVNDSMGHAAGDQLLKEVAARLTVCARTSDTLARLSGDEFCMILPNTAGPSGAEEVANKVLTALAQPFVLLDGEEFHTSGSIGITVYPDDSVDSETLLRNADMAMYRAKEQGRNSFKFFTQKMNHKAMQHKNLEQELHRALAEDELELYYQPTIDLGSGSLVGAEALLRWRHPRRGLLLPKTFIPVAEETGMIVLLGDWVLRTISTQAAVWQGCGILPPRLWVNISGRQCRDSNFVESLTRTLDEAGPQGDNSWLGLEITESMMLELADGTVDMFQRIHGLGIFLSLDDFGTGYSSLSRLKHLPVEILKTDRAFLKQVTTSERDAALTRAIVALAHSLGMKVIAEGIETEEELAFLRQVGCDIGQGYYFSTPLPARELEGYLRNEL